MDSKSHHLYHHSHQHNNAQHGHGNPIHQRKSPHSTSAAAAASMMANDPFSGKDAEDLHAWSIFRQNLNANISESALGGGGNVMMGASSANHHQQQQQHNHSNANHHSNHHQQATTPTHHHNQGQRMKNNPITNTGAKIDSPRSGAANNLNFQLRESTVNNILTHPKYGAQLKNQDPFTYLRFGLPRVKAITVNNGNQQQSSSGSNPTSNHAHHQQQHQSSSDLHKQSQNQPSVATDDDRTKTFRSGDQDRLTKDNRSRNVRNAAGGGAGVSAALNEELKRRFWGSDTNLLRSDIDSDSSGQKEFTSKGATQAQSQTAPNKQESATANRTDHSHQQYSTRYAHHPQHLTKHHHKNKHLKSSYSIGDLRYQTKRDHFGEIDGQSHHLDSGRIESEPIPMDGGNVPMYHRNSPYGMENMDPGDEDIRLDDFDGPGPNGVSSTLPPPLAKHPHLVVKDLMYEVDKSPVWRRLCGFSRQKLRILEDISFDVRGGELLAVTATSATEGTALLDVLANRHDHRNGTVRAEIYLNGVTVSPRFLNRVVAYVSQQMHFCPDMSPRQALLFAGLLMGPAVRGHTDIKRRTRTLLEELNLGEVRHARLSELTDSERKRLHIAMHLILDTEILLLDQPLSGLDIFDAFFLVEYLRQWAMVGGRSVVMTISPPTYEVFTMFNKVLLLSAGRSLYVGPRRDFLKYFTSLDFPCPPFKNPSDYYLDLVTLDDLSQEALLESSQRIDNLAEIHVRRPLSELFSSMPGPPAVTPPPYRRANMAMQFLALWIRALIFSFPYNVVQLFNRFLAALTLSLLIGAIFWQVRTGREQEYVWDRMGFVTTMLSVGVVPLLVADLSSAHKEKQHIMSEVDQGLYSLPVYLLAKMLYSAPQSILIGLTYALPACSMAGLQLHSASPNSLPFYLLLMLAYYFAMRSFVFATVWICKRRSSAACLFGLLFVVFVLCSGLTIQQRDLSFSHRWMRQLSPIRWLHESLIAWEFEPNVLTSSDGTIVSSFLCSRNPVVQQPNAILVRADCGFQTRANILKWFEYQGGNTSSPLLRPSWHAFVALLILYLVSFVIGSIVFSIRVYYYRAVDGDVKSRNQ